MEAPAQKWTRSRRDWIVDLLSLAFAGAIGLSAYFGEVPFGSVFLEVGLFVLGLAACAGLWFRRRWPLGVGVFAALASAVSPAAGGAVLVAVFSLAIHRPWRQAVAVGAMAMASGIAFYFLYPSSDSLWVMMILVAVMFSAVVGWGMYVRARRELVESLRQRARDAEADRDARLAQARANERTRIAREMHDVLAHRISLVALNAGALEYRPDASPEEVARAASVVRENAHQALEELRDVIAVLRENSDGEGAAKEPPQPTLRDLAALVDESRDSGMTVELESRAESLDDLPAAIGRTAYRVVQEGLTNARKHAPGGAARVHVSGSAGSGLTVVVANREPVGPTTVRPIPGTGTGLIGLAERVDLAGGRLTYGIQSNREFKLEAWLPWQPSSERVVTEELVPGTSP
ncbi:MAG: sensor histidine kinase [Solirubrobacterales bacterium]|nr:sensor histidine kinase [Solirubrobacterales bacterium]